ncbi:MAG: pyridoxamine 5'-phosphate oxidase family protein [Candidatus Limnocylindrales bacterium]
MEHTTTARPYPQMPPLTEEEVVSLLEAATIARLATHNPDGTIHLVPLLFRYVDGAILLGTQTISRKVKNIERDPNVTVLVDIEEMPAKGAMIYGTTTLDTDDLIAERVEIFDRTMPHEAAQGLANVLAAQFEPAVIRVVPKKIVSWDYSKPSFLG